MKGVASALLMANRTSGIFELFSNFLLFKKNSLLFFAVFFSEDLKRSRGRWVIRRGPSRPRSIYKVGAIRLRGQRFA